jgi:mannose-6-phosphate isomerase-like protein (cupin superfamily)
MDELAQFTNVYHNNISDVTESNNYFRKVIATTPNMQLVVMSIKPGEDIGYEIHPYITQFFRIEQGEGVAIVDGVAYDLRKDTALVVPLNTEHNIINTSNTEPLKLYTIYTPPNHRYNKIDVTKPSEH